MMSQKARIQKKTCLTKTAEEDSRQQSLNSSSSNHLEINLGHQDAAFAVIPPPPGFCLSDLPASHDEYYARALSVTKTQNGNMTNETLKQKVFSQNLFLKQRFFKCNGSIWLFFQHFCPFLLSINR